MKNLQNNYTTPKQSKRLLKIGVPEDSADCYFYDWAWIGGKYEGSAIQICSEYGGYRRERIMNNQIYPCWSAGRLIEILETCWTDRIESPIWYNYPGKGKTIIERVLWDFENRKLDFSKLED